MLSKAIIFREMKSENGFSLAIISQPFQLTETIQWFWDRDWTEVSIHRSCGHFVSCQKINSYLRSLQGLAVIQKQTPEKENQTPKSDISLVILTNTSVKHSDSWIPVSSSQTPVSDIHDFDTCVWESVSRLSDPCGLTRFDRQKLRGQSYSGRARAQWQWSTY